MYQCRNKRALRRYASRRSVFGLREDISVRRKWITIYPYLSKNQMDNHGYPLQCSGINEEIAH
jgi:hypothetical protein